MSESVFWRRLGAVVLLCSALSQPAAAPTEPTPPPQSTLSAELFYQLLIGEVELRSGQAGRAYQIFLEAARRSGDEQLFRRAMDVALQARAGNEALEATRAWHERHPRSADPLRLQLQILAALNRLGEAEAPLRALLDVTPADARAGVIGALPGLFERARDKALSAQTLQAALQPALDDPALRTAARVAAGRAWLAAGDSAKALELARQACRDDPAAAAPALLAIELARAGADGEPLVTEYLARTDAESGVRLSYVQWLMSGQRSADAIVQLQRITRERADFAPAFLTLGALQLEMRDLDAAQAALLRYVEIATESEARKPAEPQATAPHGAPQPQASDDAAQQEDDSPGLVQAWMMLAQLAELRGDLPTAEGWLARIDDPRRALEVQARRASLLARQGRVDEAVASLRRVPERETGDARAKLLAEAQLLRDVKRWPAAYEVYEQAVARFPDDIDILYEQAMTAEKLDRLDDMERQLRRVIELKPEHGHAHNALGYSLADRGLRLEEARRLIQRALELRPGDPFVTDSLGWVEYRLGRHEEALRLLREAWTKRPDTEIGAHLGEVLWALGRHDEARAVWRQARAKDTDNEVLRETLARLQVGL